jgi:hypothetical protein
MTLALLFNLNLDAGVSINPELVNAFISTDGTTLTLEISETVTFGAGGNGGVALAATGGSVIATYASGGTTPTLVYSLDRTLSYGESVTVSYIQPGNGIEAVDDSFDLASFGPSSVSNLSRINRPLAAVAGRFRRRCL